MAKTLYWIRGNSKNPEGVKKALEEKGIKVNDVDSVFCQYNNIVLFGRAGDYVCYGKFPCVPEDIFTHGVELHPVEEPKFKDGDFIINDYDEEGIARSILKGDFNDGYFMSYVRMGFVGGFETKPSIPFISEGSHWRLMTDKEKRHFLNIMHEHGKDWNARTKQVIDLEPTETFKPFDRVVFRIDFGAWFCGTFSHFVKPTKFADDEHCIKTVEYYLQVCLSNTLSFIVVDGSEIHHFEPYMERYLGTKIPFDEWVRPEEGGEE